MDQSYSPLTLGTSRLFAEVTPLAAGRIATDDYGFLKPSPSFFTFERLLQQPCSLVVAPPWTGKTFTSTRIEAFLRESTFVVRRDLEAWLPGQPVLPGWERWLQSGEQGVWIIDALDEAQRKHIATWPNLNESLSEAPAEALKRLRVLLFARESDISEVAPTLEDDLRKIFGDGYLKAELLILDAVNAKELLEENNFGAEDWERVLRLIERNRLQAVAGLPAALLFLARSEATAISEKDVWKAVLEKLLEEHGDYRTKFNTYLESRFTAAARVAAVLTLSGRELISASATRDEPSLSRIFPHPAQFGQIATRDSAGEALRSSMFRCSRDGHFFLHRNVREWMAAFGMESLPLAQLRPLLQLSPATLDAPASLRAEFYDVARLLAKVHKLPAVREWLCQSLTALPPGDLFTKNLANVRPFLERLEDLAARGGEPFWVNESDALRQLLVEGLDEELAGRIGDPMRSPRGRILLLRIGAQLELEEVLRMAVRITSDISENPTLRSWCSSALEQSRRADLLAQLEKFVEDSVPMTREDKEIISTLISAFVQERLWNTAHAFRFTPEKHPSNVIDATQVLARSLEPYMTIEDAVTIFEESSLAQIAELSRSAEEGSRDANLRLPPRWEILAFAARSIASSDPPDPARLRLLIPFALGLGTLTAHHNHELITELVNAFRSSEASRRELFEAAVEAERTSEPHDHQGPWLYRLLIDHDLEWLTDRLVTTAQSVPEVWSIALALSQATNRRSLKLRVNRLVREHAPDRLASFKKHTDQQRRWKHQEAKEEQRKQERKRTVQEVNVDYLVSDLEPSRRLRLLSWVNFSGNQFRPSNLVGEWSDLPTEFQQQVLDFCATALDSVEPLPVPDGSSFPVNLLYEAQAFVEVLRLNPTFNLTAERIARWLPAVLKTATDDKSQLLESCFRASQEVTEEVVLEAVDRELVGESSYSVVLQNLPDLLWSDRVTQWVIERIEGTEFPAGRAALLELLASRRPVEAKRLARDINRRLSIPEIFGIDDETGLLAADPDLLGIRALDVLLALDSETAWPQVEEGARLLGARFLEYLRGLTDSARTGLRVDWQSWPPEMLGRLAAALFRSYPPDEDPPDTGGWVTRSYELRLLRWRLLEHLVALETPDSSAAIKLISESHPKASEIAERMKASREANALQPLRAISPSLGISVEDAGKIFDDQLFRLIRSEHDLLEVVVETLDIIARDIDSDLSLLYYGSDPSSKRRREEALQIYVRRRLSDLLPGKTLDREVQINRGRLTDIRVLAPVIGRQETVMVVIEVKWSDNSGRRRGVSTGLRRQLGEDYLLRGHLSCGIFLVGWNGILGTWHDSSPRPERTANSLRQALEGQTERFRREHSTIDIRAIVWDLKVSKTSARKGTIEVPHESPPATGGRGSLAHSRSTCRSSLLGAAVASRLRWSRQYWRCQRSTLRLCSARVSAKTWLPSFLETK